MEDIEKERFSCEALSPEQAGEHAQDIVSVYRDCWLTTDTYVNHDLNISKADLESNFEHFDEMVKDWQEKILTDHNRKVWVVKSRAGEIVGFCIAKHGDSENELEYIYLLPQVQGKGKGKELMLHALEWLGEDKPIALYGAAYNTNAQEFYSRFGFTLSDEEIKPKILPNGTALPSMKMVRDSG